MMVCVTKLTGRDFVLFFSKCGRSHLSLLFMCLFPCECLNLYCLKAFLYTIRYYCMVCVCLSVSEPAKHVPVCFCSLLLKGCLDFGFNYLKNLFLSFFPSYNYLLYFFYSLLSARTLIKHTLSAWKTLNSLLFLLPNDRRATIFTILHLVSAIV